jgi:hypothetical protein
MMSEFSEGSTTHWRDRQETIEAGVGIKRSVADLGMVSDPSLLSKGVSVPSGSFQPKLAVSEMPTADGLALIKIFLSAQQSQRLKAHRLLHPNLE